MGVDSFKTKGWWGHQEFRRHKSLLRMTRLPFGRTKRRPGFPPPPAPSLAPSMGHRERQCVLKWICWAAQGCAQRPHKLREQTVWAPGQDILRASQGVEAFTELLLLPSIPLYRGASSERPRDMPMVIQNGSQDSNPSPPSQATSLGNQNQKPL